jgi:glutamyl-tRNA synthetase
LARQDGQQLGPRHDNGRAPTTARFPDLMNASNVRVRFAPSPTGYLHVGSARTALFNWLYARHTGGEFVLRIEDTDDDRNRPELLDTLFELMGWLGLDWDGDPVFQSNNRDRHREVVAALLTDGHAYLCDADNERIDGVELIDGHAVRFAVGDEATITFDDLVRGPMSFEADALEDFVIWRSNGSATFILANAVDDADMGITHAIRGEDLLSTAPKVQMVLNALGMASPTYAHLPLLVNEGRKKLSKRRDDVSIGDFRDRGYLPEALVNYLALLGWGPPDEIEIRPISEIVSLFDVTDVNSAPAFFDMKKLDHFNEHYLRALSPTDFVNAVEPFVTGPGTPWSAEDYDPVVLETLMTEVAERVSTLDQVPAVIDWLFGPNAPEDEKSWKKGLVKAKRSAEILELVADRFATCGWDEESIKSVVLGVGDELEVRSQVPVRVATTGRNHGVPLFGALVLLGRERTLARIEAARVRLEA